MQKKTELPFKHVNWEKDLCNKRLLPDEDSTLFSPIFFKMAPRAQSSQNIPLCTNTVLHSFSSRCLLVLTFLPDDTAKHHHSRAVQRFLLQFLEV